MSPLRPETIHAVGRVFDNQPSVGKWETVTGEGGLGVRIVDLGMVGGDREREVRRIVMEEYGSMGRRGRMCVDHVVGEVFVGVRGGRELAAVCDDFPGS